MPEIGVLADGGITRQTERAIRNLAAVPDAVGSSLDKITKTTCFLKSMGGFFAFIWLPGLRFGDCYCII